MSTVPFDLARVCGGKASHPTVVTESEPRWWIMAEYSNVEIEWQRLTPHSTTHQSETRPRLHIRWSLPTLATPLCPEQSAGWVCVDAVLCAGRRVGRVWGGGWESSGPAHTHTLVVPQLPPHRLPRTHSHRTAPPLPHQPDSKQRELL